MSSEFLLTLRYVVILELNAPFNWLCWFLCLAWCRLSAGVAEAYT